MPLCSRSIAENFRTKILNEHDKDSGAIETPVRTLGSVSFLYLRHSDLYILCLVKSNVNVMLSFKFMTSVSALCALGLVCLQSGFPSR